MDALDTQTSTGMTDEERSIEGLAPHPLRQATELDLDRIVDLVGEPASRDPDVRQRLAQVVWAMYCDEPAETMAGVSRRFGVTTERVRQLHAHALRLLRHPTRRPAVKDGIRPDTRLYHAIFFGCS